MVSIHPAPSQKRLIGKRKSVLLLCGVVSLFVYRARLGTSLGSDGSGSPSRDSEPDAITTWREPLDSTASLRHSADSCTVDWSGLERNPDKGMAAVYTPYNIVFGGGERYILSVAAAMQEMGYVVDMLVGKSNVCKSKAQLLSVARGLRVDLNASRINFVPVVNDRGSLRLYGESQYMLRAAKYSVFVSLGNEKIAPVNGIGHVSFYMCQFPFDLDRLSTMKDWRAISSYDYVLLNSEFTYRWYSLYSVPAMRASWRHFGLNPQVEVLHPPVQPFTLKSSALPAERKHIVLLGRFFSGRQSKGHATAIRIFKQIVPQLPKGTQLHLVGTLMPSMSDYLQSLKREAVGAPIIFHVASPSSELEQVLQSALVQWHLTGAEMTTSDPASEEHFGISIAEGMTAGVIPVVLNRGGVGDIVYDGYNGFLAPTPDAVADATVNVFNLPQNVTMLLQQHALESTKQFHQKAFSHKLQVLVSRGFLTKPFRHLVNATRDVVYGRSFNLPERSENAAVLIEPRQHYALEYVVKNVLYHLKGNWSLYVYHGLSNKQYVRDALSSISGIQFRQLDSHILSIPMLNRMLLNVSFWDGIDAKRALLFQTDSLLLRGNIDRFLEYDYVGAPWHWDNERWQHHRQDMPQGVGNGGLSLRSVAAMRELAAQLGPVTNGSQQEDMEYAQAIEHDGNKYKIAPRAEAYRFCVEVPCVELESKNQTTGGECNPLTSGIQTVPTALHAAWYYWSHPADRHDDLLRMLEISVCGDVQRACGSTSKSMDASAARGAAAAAI